MSCAGRGIVLRQVRQLFSDGTLGGLGDGQLLERYLTNRDEMAFAALVDRHGPMVLGLCRRMLRDPPDVEDAFQATFLALARTGRAIRDRSLLGTWLYRVAFRVARDARARTLRRRSCERLVATPEAAGVSNSSEVLEEAAVLAQEMSRLPEKYRAPLILCYFEGRTHDQAALELSCPVGTVRSRLARGRDLLKKRLMRQGYVPTAAVLGTRPAAPAGLCSEIVPWSLASATVDTVVRWSSATTIQVGTAAAPVLTLTEGVLTSMKLTQLKWIALALVATGLAAGGAVAVSYPSAAMPSAGDSAAFAPVPRAAEIQRKAASTPRILKGWGEVIDPDGDCEFNLANGGLTIKVPAPAAPRKGHGLEAEAKALNAPRVLREIEGDFIADVEVGGTFKPGGRSANPRVFPFVGAGLLLWSDEGNYLRLERAAIDRNGQLVPYALFEERRDSRPIPPAGGIQVPDQPTLLRLERHGDQFSAQVSVDGMAWRAFPPRVIKLPAKLKLGVAAISSSRQPFVVTFENFRVFRPE